MALPNEYVDGVGHDRRERHRHALARDLARDARNEVLVDVTASFGGRSGSAQTSFTPREC